MRSNLTSFRRKRTSLPTPPIEMPQSRPKLNSAAKSDSEMPSSTPSIMAPQRRSNPATGPRTGLTFFALFGVDTARCSPGACRFVMRMRQAR
jgi:hypothetical protein